MATTLHPRFYRFGTFQLDVRAGELRRNGSKLRLPGQSLQVLLRLLERPGEAVTREELRQQLWPADTFVDFDEGLNSAVKKLRAALDDSADNPRFVETLPRRGYRFIAPVTRIEAEGQVASAPPTPARPPLWHRPALWLAAGLLLVISAATIVWYPRPAASPIRSIAVLPLRNLSNDPEQEYFSEGLTDELITRLASLPGLHVISLTSVMQYENTHKPLPQIAKELNVDAVVEGSVLRSGDRVRITAQLVEASSDRHLWAHSYESEQRDILTLQNEVTRNIAENIKLNLDPASRERLAHAFPVDPEAHENYLRGRYHWSRRTPAEIQTAIRYFEQAVALDSNYARSYAGLAECYALIGGYTATPQSEFMPRARAAALKALELDEQLPEAHTALAVIAQDYDWDWPTAEREYRRAIELDPSDATAHHWYAEFLAQQGRFDEAFSEIERARQLDPLSPIIATDHGIILYYSRQYDRAVEELRGVIARDPDFPRAHGLLVRAYVGQGRTAEALAELEIWRRLDGHSPWFLGEEVQVYARAGKKEQARTVLQELVRISRRQPMGGSPLCYAYLAMGQNEEALALLQGIYKEHSMPLTELKVDPTYDPLRDDPRFQDLLRGLRLAP